MAAAFGAPPSHIDPTKSPRLRHTKCQPLSGMQIHLSLIPIIILKYLSERRKRGERKKRRQTKETGGKGEGRKGREREERKGEGKKGREKKRKEGRRKERKK